MNKAYLDSKVCVLGVGVGVDSGGGEFFSQLCCIYYKTRLKISCLKIGTHCSLYCSD